MNLSKLPVLILLRKSLKFHIYAASYNTHVAGMFTSAMYQIKHCFLKKISVTKSNCYIHTRYCNVLNQYVLQDNLYITYVNRDNHQYVGIDRMRAR